MSIVANLFFLGVRLARRKVTVMFFDGFDFCEVGRRPVESVR
jgi:hypothetical protein